MSTLERPAILAILFMTTFVASPDANCNNIHRDNNQSAQRTVAAAPHAAHPSNVMVEHGSQVASSMSGSLLDQLLACIRVNPNDLSLRRMLAQEFLKRGLTVKAAEEIREVMQVAGENTNDLTLYADACRFSGDSQAAIASYKKALTLAPMNAKAWSGLSFAYAQSGDKQTAMSTCRSGLSQIGDSKGRKELTNTLNSIQNMQPVQSTEIHAS